MEAYSLKQVDETFKRRDLAWSILAAKSTNKNGEPLYKNFDEFFDYQKALAKVSKLKQTENEMNTELVRIAKRLAEYRRMRGGEGK